MIVYRTRYKDISALAIESRGLRALYLPEYGAKLASLVCLKTGREFMAQAPGKRYKPLAYDGSYGDAECSGFDDMLPTIDPCFCEDFPWSGVRMPDHGEVCSLKWTVLEDAGHVEMSVYGVRFPYHLVKRISFESENTLRIDYSLRNLSGFDLDFIWAAHPMFNAEAGGEIIVPYPDGSPLVCIFSADGRYGDRWTWPVAQTRAGTKTLHITDSYSKTGDSFKYFFADKMPGGRFGYRYPSDGAALFMEVSEETVPYFSIWSNNGSFHELHTFAFEACTGAFDRPDAAKLHRMNSVLKADGEYRWYMKLSAKSR